MDEAPHAGATPERPAAAAARSRDLFQLEYGIQPPPPAPRLRVPAAAEPHIARRIEERSTASWRVRPSAAAGAGTRARCPRAGRGCGALRRSPSCAVTRHSGAGAEVAFQLPVAARGCRGISVLPARRGISAAPLRKRWREGGGAPRQRACAAAGRPPWRWKPARQLPFPPWILPGCSA